ncbi:MAG: hypothetical protein ACYDCO_00205 [Armatimonadota bacterium]
MKHSALQRVVWLLLVVLLLGALAANAQADLPRLKTITVKETAGQARTAWPVLVGVLLNEKQFTDAHKDLALLRVDAGGQATPVPFQVMSVIAPTYAAENAELMKDKTSPLRMVELCFLTDLAPNGQQAFELRGKPGANVVQPAPTVTLKTEGKDFGWTIDTGPAVFGMDPRTGQLSSYLPQLAGYDKPATFFQGAIHWNPDTWTPPSSWGHTTDWDSAKPERRPELTVWNGPLCFRTLRTGTMPLSNGTKVAISYTLFAGSPYILESSRMEFTADTAVNAVRNNELVFSRGVHTHAAAADETGKVSVWQAHDENDINHFYGNLASVGPDVPWLGLFHQRLGYGIAIVNQDRFTQSGAPGRRDLEGGYYYFNDYGEHGTGENAHLNFLYMSRALMWGNLVPKGTVFGEHSAFLPFKVGQEPDRFADVARWAAMLRRPPVIEVK